MEDRQTIATDIAQACAKLNKDEALNSMPSIRNSEVGGVKKIPTISEPLLAVSARQSQVRADRPRIYFLGRCRSVIHTRHAASRLRCLFRTALFRPTITVKA